MTIPSFYGNPEEGGADFPPFADVLASGAASQPGGREVIARERRTSCEDFREAPEAPEDGKPDQLQGELDLF